MNRAIFLDRDGTICEDWYGNTTCPASNVAMPDRLKLLPGAAEAIKKFNSLNLPVIIITNQPAIAKGWLTESKLEGLHKRLADDLAKEGARVDAIYYCPHHPEQRVDIPDRAKKYRIECNCRKPKPGMLLQAAREHGICLKASFFVGDHSRDMIAGRAAGCKTVFVKYGSRSGPEDARLARPDACADSLLEASRLIEKIVRAPAVILAGGRGERLRPLTDSLPKPMLPVAGKPVMEWQLELLGKHGIRKVFVCGHYLLDKIVSRFGDGSRYGLQIEYIDDGATPLGSGGALRNLKGKVCSDFVVLNGDVMTTLDVTALLLSHFSSGAAATVVVRETDHPHDSDIIQMAEDGKALRFFSKKDPHKEGNLGSAGVCILSPGLLDRIEAPCNLEGDLIASLIGSGEDVRCFVSADYFKDMGTPERYERVQKDFHNLTRTAAGDNLRAKCE